MSAVAEKPVYRVGPNGIRRVVDAPREIEEWIDDYPAFLPDIDVPVVRIRPEAEWPSKADLAEMAAREEERRRNHELWSQCRARELRGELPGFSAWANERVIHLSYTPFCAFPVTQCGQRIRPNWKTAVGIQDMHRGRVCKRCGWQVARSLAKANGLPEPPAHEWFVYRLTPAERRSRWKAAPICKGSGAATCEPGSYMRQPCPECGINLIPRGDGKVRQHRAGSAS